MDQGRGAHGAGFQGHHQHPAAQTVIAAGGPGGPQGQDLGMGRGIVQGHGPVVGAGQQTAIRRHQHRAHRHFVLAGGLPRLVQGQTHEGLPAPARRRGRHGPAAGAYQRPVAYRITILHRCSTTCSGVSHTVTSLSISSRLMKPPLAMLVRSHSSRPAQ